MYTRELPLLHIRAESRNDVVNRKSAPSSDDMFTVARDISRRLSAYAAVYICIYMLPSVNTIKKVYSRPKKSRASRVCVSNLPLSRKKDSAAAHTSPRKYIYTHSSV